MGRGPETTREERDLVVKLALEGKSLREIAQIVGRSHSTIHGIVKKFLDYGITCNKQRVGRRPILSEEEKREIKLDFLKNPNQSITKLTSEICSRIGRPVSRKTIKRIFETVGYSGITEVGDSPAAEEEMDEENGPAVDEEQMQGGAEFSNKKGRHRKKQLYQNIRKQMEFYFSDANLTKDRFLGKLMMEEPNVDISILMSFNKIRALTTDAKDIVSALRSSELLSVTEDGTKIFRTTPITQKTNTDDCTIYVEQLPLDAQHDWLKEVFSAYGNVSYVSIPKFKNGKIKGFAFVEFETPEEANKTLEAFVAKGCRLSPEMPPETLCSIQTFEPEEVKSEPNPNEEIKRESADDDPDSASAKKKKKKKVKMQLSEETNIEESDVGKPEDDSDSTHPTKLKKRKKSDDNETEDNNAEKESIGDDTSPKKKKRKKSESTESIEKGEENADDDASKVEQSDVTEDQSEKKKKKRKIEELDDKVNDEELEGVECPISKKKRKKSQERVEEVTENKEIVSDEADKHSERKKRKRKSEEVEETGGEDEEQPEVVENEQVEETGEEDMAEEGVEGDGKKRRRRKKHKKKKPDVEADRLQILSKKEWKRLRNKYLDLQKLKMKCLKHYMGRNKWGKITPARSQHSNGSMQEREEPSMETTKLPDPEKKPRISYTPGVIVHAMLEEPVMDVRKFKADVKMLSEVEYVDVMMGGNETFIRCATSSAAENLIANAPWKQTQLLKGDDEKKYWDRIFEDRNEKFSQKVRVKQRGRDKVLRRAERELGKHIRFDD